MSITDFIHLIAGLIAVILTYLGTFNAARRSVQRALEKRLEKISDGNISTIEDLVAIALTEQKLREDTPIAVFGDIDTWAELRRGRFLGAKHFDKAIPGTTAIPDGKVAVVKVTGSDEEAEPTISTRGERYVLIYKKGPPYKGEKPKGALVTYANSEITLEARLPELLHHMNARNT